MQSLQARLDMTDGMGGMHTLREFEQRAVQIEAKSQQVAVLAAGLEGLGEKIDEVRKVWEPQLDGLIRRISEGFAENFGKIQCVGEVGLLKGEDFGEWAVQVWVKFRCVPSLFPPFLPLLLQLRHDLPQGICTSS